MSQDDEMRRGAVKHCLQGVLLLTCSVLSMGMTPVAPAGIGYGDLASVTSAGLCIKRPSTSGAPYYSAMRPASGALSHVQVMEHVGTRLGFGLSPLSPLVPSKSNDCTTVFFAEELARQLGEVGLNKQHPLVTTIRGGITPLTTFTRSDINAAFNRFIALDATSTADDDLRWAAWTQISQLMIIRELFGSQTLQSNGEVIDHQMNLEELFSEFWFNHFNVSSSKAPSYVLGSNGYAETMKAQIGSTFYLLLRAVMRQPGMIVYLDNQRNVYDAATDTAGNQNLARELLELHTFVQRPKHDDSDTTSVYGQSDVEAMAKVLSGWHAYGYAVALPSADSGFVYNAALSARVPVTFMGVEYPDTGEARVEAVLRWLANHPQTKQGICTKLAGLLYAPALVGSARDACVAAWGTDGQLKSIYSALLKRPEFWSGANYRNLYRTPQEFIVAAMRQMGANVKDLEYGVRAANLTPARFAPATLMTQTPADFVASNTAFTQIPIRNFIRVIQIHMEKLSGVLRTNWSPPTGYSQDGSSYFSTSYVDNISRLPIELAGLFDSIPAETRRDRIRGSVTTPATQTVSSTNPTGVMWSYVVNSLGMGYVVTAPGFTAAKSPYVLHATQQAALGSIASSSSNWSYWASSPTNRYREKTWAPAVLGTAAQLRK